MHAHDHGRLPGIEPNLIPVSKAVQRLILPSLGAKPHQSDDSAPVLKAKDFHGNYSQLCTRRGS